MTTEKIPKSLENPYDAILYLASAGILPLFYHTEPDCCFASAHEHQSGPDTPPTSSQRTVSSVGSFHCGFCTRTTSCGLPSSNT